MNKLWAVLPGVLKTVGGILGLPVLGQAGDTLAATQLTPAQQVALTTALQQHEEAMAAVSLEELKTVMSESLAEIASPDKYVARARPTGLYLAYLATAVCVGALVAGVKLDTGALVTLIAPCWGQAAWYTWNRTQEKLGTATTPKGTA